MAMTPNERALLSELLKLQSSYEAGLQDLQSVFEATSLRNDQISQHLNALSDQVTRLEATLSALNVKSTR
mgnify:CR=1 FL=1